MFCSGKTFYVEPNLCLHEIKHGGGRSSDSSAQVLRNSRLEFRLLPPSQRYALQISSRGRSERMPGERIAKHLSERAPTPPAATLTSSHLKGSPSRLESPRRGLEYGIRPCRSDMRQPCLRATQVLHHIR